jgi:zinc/manganese transport system substrate-binding protein
MARTESWRANQKRMSRTNALVIGVLFVTSLGSHLAMASSGVIHAVGVENEYADVVSQIGGKYVDVSTIESDPNTDPHTFEVSPKVASRIATAQLIVENDASGRSGGRGGAIERNARSCGGFP